MNKFFYAATCFLVLFTGACKNEVNEQRISNNEVLEKQEKTENLATNGEPWTKQQLLEPRDLAHLIKNSEDSLMIFSLGAGNIIPGSKDTGPSGETQSLNNLKKELELLPKDTEIVIYCGCCPFDICPNIRPAFSLLNEMQFTNHQLLNLRDNIKVDWLDKGYPVGN
ncbi:rhodanese-like domain-containing protein [Salinimicrobium terrae]|uniref:rhodanese-like domain-containing protein n=1 Tax=Salinimicrobium terrae TaxID=470866 RepID=UPI000410B6AD|nr:rhodanese-like domain-containing protein [Salinimicrobium terrae]